MVIRVRDLKKNYGEKAAVQGISFEVKPGEIFGFLGPNGAGKTTTIKLLTGQILPSYGDAFVLGKDASRESEAIRLEMGIVPENANLYERLTVGQNLEFFCRLFECDKGNIDYYLEQVKLEKEKNTQVKKLSKGMRQRVLLVRAMLHTPKILFLDEPTSGLDPASANDIHQLLLKLNRENGVTIFLTSHNMEEVEKLCDKIAFLNNGLIVAMGTPDELKLKYTNKKIRVLIANDRGLEEVIIGLEGNESADQLALWVRDGKVKAIHSCEPTLAEIFVKVTGRELA